MMNWENLLSLKRFGDTEKRIRNKENEFRLGFEVDYDRVIFSDSFRSLQDKTQVIPFSKTDFVHTRLTHSLEVAVVGRSLGRLAGKYILENEPFLVKEGYLFTDFGAIVASACLAHDIGNPPFGHSGENAIGHFFKNGKGKQYKNELTKEEFEDLANFEGNANGLHILTKNSKGNEGGLRLSYATLGTFIKYPKASIPFRPTTHVADKKYGFFQKDKMLFEEIGKELGMYDYDTHKYRRHPLTYLVEAADDLCYTIIDFEDGINLGWIDESFGLEYLIPIVKDKINTKKYRALQTVKERMGYLRSLFINALVEDTIDIFSTNLPTILEGNFKESLIKKSRFKLEIEDILKISQEKIYRSPQVLEKEITGFKIISKLLNKFSTALVNDFRGVPTSYDRLLLRFFNPLWKYEKKETLYETLLQTCCFVASLTDGKAIEISEKI